MNNSVIVRDNIARLLKSEKSFKGLVSGEISGCFSAVLDLALPDDNGDCEIYKIAVIPQDIQKELRKKAKTYT